MSTNATVDFKPFGLTLFFTLVGFRGFLDFKLREGYIVKLRNIITAGALGVSLMAMPLVSMADSFTQQQQDDIKHIVKDYLIENPEILLDVSKALQKKQQQKMMQQANNAIESNGDELFNSNSPAVGNAKGDVTVVEFFDYQCVHCKKMAPVIKGLLEKKPNVRVVYKDFPIFGKSSQFAAEAALAAAMQGKYLALHEALLNKSQRLSPSVVLQAADSVGINTAKLKKDMKSETVQKELTANRQLAEKLRLMGTPAFVVGSTPGGKYKEGDATFFVPGAASEASLSQLVDKAAASAK